MDPDDDAVPVSADDVEGVEEPVVDEMSAGELALITIVAGAVIAEITGAAADKFLRLSLFRKRIRTYVGGLMRRTRAAADTAVADAVRVGRDTATESLTRTGRDASPSNRRTGRGNPVQPGNPAPDAPRPTAGDTDAPRGGRRRAPDFPDDLTVDDLRATAPIGPRTARGVTIRPPNPLLPQLEEMAPQMIAAAEGMYQQVITEVMADPLRSEADRLRLAQKLIDRYAARGITAYIDRGGRKWSMTSYIEMATRTVSAQTAIDAHVALLAEHGYDLVRVSIHANCSNLCQPFQGHLLSVTGSTTSYGGTEPWRGRVITSLADARRRGFNHPNCKHWVTMWVPGDSLPTAPIVDPADYQATQRLRYLERHVRASKRRHAAALSPQAARAAKARTRALQARIRDHVAEHPTVPRIRRREQIDVSR